MRILILTNMDMGLYKFRRELLEALLKEHEVFFCVPQGDFLKQIEKIGCKYIPCDEMDRRSINPFKDLMLLSRYNKILKDNKPDIVLTYTIKPNVYGGILCACRKIPCIANVTGLGTSIENGGLLSRITMTLYKIGLSRAYCVFFQNSNNKDLFVRKGIVKSKTRIIPGSGVNLDENKIEPYPNVDNKTHFLFVGRIMKDKGIGELLNAVREIRLSYPNVLLDIVGFCDEDYHAELDKAEKMGDIIYHGFQKDVHSFYTACHCAVLPSYHEGTANVMLEAASTGRPVITTRVPGCRETFDEDITGFGCEAGNTESLIEAMVKFLSLSQEDRKNMGMAARLKMEKEFDRGIVIKAYQEEIKKIENLQKKRR